MKYMVVAITVKIAIVRVLESLKYESCKTDRWYAICAKSTNLACIFRTYV